MTLEKKEIIPKDISQKFLGMSASDFDQFLRTLKNEPALSIEIDWVDKWTVRRLKAFLEDPRKPANQIRTAAIRATREQYMQELNVFASGVKWIEVK